MFVGLPLDFDYPSTKWAAWADFGWPIHPATDRARTGQTCRSCISIYGTLMLTLGANLQTFLAGAGSATAIAATGCTFNMSIKIRSCFFGMSFSKRSRHSVKGSPPRLLACQSPDLRLTGWRVIAYGYMAAHCGAVLCFDPGILSCSILPFIAFRQALYSRPWVRGWGKPQMCLHQLTSPAFLKAPDFSKVWPTFEAALVILVGPGGGCWMGTRLCLNKKGSRADER